MRVTVMAIMLKIKKRKRDIPDQYLIIFSNDFRLERYLNGVTIQNITREKPGFRVYRYKKLITFLIDANRYWALQIEF